MSKGILLVSLDFELFWGVLSSRTVESYSQNVLGVHSVIPRLLDLFESYNIRSTWAIVGMLMCKDFDHWASLRPTVFPGYINERLSTYNYESTIRSNPKLFFARDLIQLLKTHSSVEIASHSYSHFFCGEAGSTVEQFFADIQLATHLASEMDIDFDSFIFPRNQILPQFFDVIRYFGMSTFRGNLNSRLLRSGSSQSDSIAIRALRFADSYISLSGSNTSKVEMCDELINLPASFFLRPVRARAPVLEYLKLHRIKAAMTRAAMSGEVFHLWWHPHNFGVSQDRNLATLEAILGHFSTLQQKYGMMSLQMREAASVKECAQ
jgi:hypothetical protein